MEFKQIKSLKEHKAAVYALCKANEEHLIFSGGSDRHVILWNLKTLSAEKVVAKSPTTIISLLYIKAHNYLLIGQIEGGVHVIDLELGQEIKYLKQHKGYIFDLKYLKEKQELIVASGDGSISIWSMVNFNLLYQVQITEGKIRKMDLSEDETLISLALGNGEVCLLKTTDWTEHMRIKGGASAVNVARFHPNPDFLLLGEKDAHLSKINLLTQNKELDLPAHYWAIYDLVYSPSKLLFATASRDKTVKIWNAEELKVLKRFEGLKDQAHTHSVNVLLWLDFESFLISSGDDGMLKVWQILD